MSQVICPAPGELPPLCEREALRYAACRQPDEQTLSLLRDCWQEAEPVLRPQICWLQLPVTTTEDLCDLGIFQLPSRKLAAHLAGCQQVVLLGATVGVELDRLIARNSRLSPARALLLQAIGTERVEALCDWFCAHYEAEHNCHLTARFSPGYGDLPLESQLKIFPVLDCSRKIGLTLNGSLLMSPSKSVTALAGLTDQPPIIKRSKCADCSLITCSFRR